jgi:predicted AAA+ superfamily ATPase
MRYLEKYLQEDLHRKMVFVGGPRQVGKTTLAKSILSGSYPDGRYFNWDFDEDRHDIIERKWTDSTSLLVFDELHKFPRWKSWLKGIYDVSHELHKFLVTGSARLDIYRKGGDSLLGRYHYWRLHPFTQDENPLGLSPQETFERLMTLGGFPEPFLVGDERFARRWRRERFDRILREDVRDLESIRNIQNLSLFVDLLRRRVGGLITISNLANDLQISPKTAKSWLELAERMYLLFAVRPYTKSLARAVLKPPKVYFYDNGDVIGEDGARFENFIATHLLKRLNFLEDRDGHRYELKFIRDKEGREVDFAIVKDGELLELIEAKWNDDTVSRHLRYYVNKLKPIKATQIVAKLRQPYDRDGIRVTDSVSYFCEDFYNS